MNAARSGPATSTSTDSKWATSSSVRKAHVRSSGDRKKSLFDFQVPNSASGAVRSAAAFIESKVAASTNETKSSGTDTPSTSATRRICPARSRRRSE